MNRNRKIFVFVGTIFLLVVLHHYIPNAVIKMITTLVAITGFFWINWGRAPGRTMREALDLIPAKIILGLSLVFIALKMIEWMGSVSVQLHWSAPIFVALFLSIIDLSPAINTEIQMARIRELARMITPDQNKQERGEILEEVAIRWSFYLDNNPNDVIPFIKNVNPTWSGREKMLYEEICKVPFVRGLKKTDPF